MSFTLVHALRRRLLFRLVLIALLSAVAGGGFATTTFAEARTNLYVPGASYVGAAITQKQSQSGSYIYAIGTSSSSTTMYEIRAHIRYWHWRPASMGGPSKQEHNTGVINWSTGAATQRVGSNGYGDKATTKSHFRLNSGSSTVAYYTSYPDNSASCTTHWYTGEFC